MPVTDIHAAEYQLAVDTERESGNAWLLSVWDSGHTFRKYDDSAAEIAEVVGRHRMYVVNRMRIAGDFTRAKFLKFITKNEIGSLNELMRVVYGSSVGSSAKRSLAVPASLISEAASTDVDLMTELKWFLAEVKFSELRAILTKFATAHTAGRKAA